MKIEDFKISPLSKFNNEWALLTAGTKDKFNTMTVSWGGMGTLWKKPVVTVYVKPIRYTYEFMENNDYFTLSFYDAKYKKDLGVLGGKSGRDCDKVALTNLTPKFIENWVSFEQANTTIVCKKIYFQDLNKSQLPNTVIENWYKNEPVHRMYIGEVAAIYSEKEK
ncbi:MAG: flavin reductase [Christensenellaceae bacterium]|jgi:flavin reductase (DIM6/NTAB) family NADH-FMN oxidoreductase RutF|nr:flavin reductase [Christensenellaceae bacterium]